jgi:hypothetical protein
VSEAELHRWLCWLQLALAPITFLAVHFVTAPYGRHARPGFGPTVSARLGWILMESPASLLWLAIFLMGAHRAAPVPLLLATLWQAHYLHRTFVFPFRLPATGSRMPLSIALSGVGFNCLNAYINARWISQLGDYPLTWLADPRFALGVLVFVLGAIINVRADNVLLRLRRRGGYHIPHGGLFDRVSCPNYLGEMVEWIGWAIATWSLPGLAFALYTIANLAPRARAHHQWYRGRFPNYPDGRRVLLPYLW